MVGTEKALSWILKGGLLLTPFLVLVVTRPLYFPFITGKNFAFRILIEILAAVWVVAALKFPRFRPRSSALGWAVIAFIAVLGLAAIFSISPYRSFWSNFERMEGYAALLHLAIYFWLLGSVFTSERDWRIFFYTSLGASVVISLYAVMQLLGRFDIHQGGTRVDATLGNATYLAAYLLFHIFFLIWFFLRTRNLYLRIAFLGALVLEAVILYHTATRGAILGMLGGLFLLTLWLVWSRQGPGRRWALAGLGTVVLVPILFFMLKDAALVQRSKVLQRFASISLSETTTQSRFTIWGMALKGWRDRPIIGWGQESFIYVFSKYYEPTLWRQEPWFDRAHNVFLDWLTAGGILGLATYLSMFAAAFWILARSFRVRAADAASVGVLGALLAAHFFENLFVFDNLTSYLLFFAVLAYIHSAAVRLRDQSVAPSAVWFGGAIPSGAVAGGVAIVAAVLGVALWTANVKPILAAKGIIDVLVSSQTREPAGKVDAVIAMFKEGVGRNTFGTMELREQMSQLAGPVAADQSLANQDKVKFLQFVIGELETERRDFPSNIRAKAFLASLYLTAGRPADALEAVNEVFEISNRRPQFYFVAAEAYLAAGERAQAIAVLRRAYDLAPDYPEAIANLATVLILDGQSEESEALLMKHYGTAIVAEPRFAQAYLKAGQPGKAVLIWQRMAESSPGNYQYRAQFGIGLAMVGRTAEAIREIERAIELYPPFKAQGDAIIQQVRAGNVQGR